MRPFRRFIVFGFDRYYPAGGFNDIRGSFDSLEEIEDLIEEDEYWFFFDSVKYSSYQVFDCEKKVMVNRLDKYPKFLSNS